MRSALTPPDRKMRHPSALLLSVVVLAACSADEAPRPPCLHGGVTALDGLEPFTLDQELAATYDAPAGEPPGTVTLRAYAEGPGSRTGNPPGVEEPHCLAGLRSVQWSSAEIDVDVDGLAYTLEVPFRSARLERELEGEGVHVSADVTWRPKDLPDPLVAFTRSALENVFRERPALDGFDWDGPRMRLMFQQGTPNPASGILVYQVSLLDPETPRNEQRLDTSVIELLSAQLALPAP